MTEQHDPSPTERAWIWAIDVPVDPDIPDVYQPHDQAMAFSPTPLELARLLALQIAQDTPAFWRIRITNPANFHGPEDLIYTSADHRAWIATPEAVGEIARLKLLIGELSLIEDPDPAEADDLVTETELRTGRRPDWRPDAPPDAVHWHPGLARSLSHFEGLMGDDGAPDSARILVETGDMLAEVLRVALKHAMDRHSDEPWTVCDGSAALVAKVAATYVSAYLAPQREA